MTAVITAIDTKSTRLYSWACPTRVDGSGKVTHSGCGGYWGPDLPEQCPRCKGPLLLLAENIRAIPLDR